MGRVARVVVPGVPYHITHRGNRGQDIFFSPEEREQYKEWLLLYSNRYGLDIWTYCLMTNHVHIEAEPHERDSLARTMGRTHGRFAQWQNRRYGWTGHLWANRCYSTPLDEEHAWAAARYIELNPVRAGLVSRAEDYEWSSARCHAKGVEDALLSPKRPFPGDVRNWSRWLCVDDSSERVEAVRRNTASGRPSGTESFVKKLEEELGRLILNAKPQRRSRW